MWAHQHYQVSPDILTAAKPLANGIPIGAVILSQHVSDSIQPGDHGTTFGGNPFACSVACHVLDRVHDQTFLNDVSANGELAMQLLSNLANKYPDLIDEVRGKGLIFGMAMKPKGAHEKVVELCRQDETAKLLVCTAGANVVRILPPLIATSTDIRKAASSLDRALSKVNTG